MTKNCIILLSMFFLCSCTGIRYYEQHEFLIKYDQLVMDFDEILENPIKKSQLKKLNKEFRIMERQLYEKNENFIRINENIVNEYSKSIEYYRNIIKDLED